MYIQLLKTSINCLHGAVVERQPLELTYRGFESHLSRIDFFNFLCIETKVEKSKRKKIKGKTQSGKKVIVPSFSQHVTKFA
jgi:hypothetical protein